jgi:hypothetical protein
MEGIVANQNNKNDIDAKRRLFLKRVLNAGFAVPAIATFSAAAKATEVQNYCSPFFGYENLIVAPMEYYVDPACASDSTTTWAPTTPAATTTPTPV